jgi:hypothetical protein
MKKTSLIFLLMALVFTNFAIAQDEKPQDEMRTLFGNNDKISHGGYGALLINYSQFDGKDVVLVGARGGWLINHGITLGIGGYGFANQISIIDGSINNPDGDRLYLSGGYGGLLVEPIIFPMKPIHISIPILIGAGGAAIIDEDYYHNNYDEYYNDLATSPFFVFEPGIEIELNVVKFMRIGIGGYYRYTSGMSLGEQDEHILDGFSAGLSLKFGKF